MLKSKIAILLKKHWIIPIVIFLCIIRFCVSFNLPNFYISNLYYDDNLMVSKLSSLLSGEYLGVYMDTALTKGIAYPIFLLLSYLLKISYSTLLTLIYISACVFFIYALSKIIKNKGILLTILLFLLFNPISYSSELFQRLYRNSLSYSELLFFLGIVINIIGNKKSNIINYISLGLIISVMYLTKEDNIWIIIILILLMVYKLHKSIKNIIHMCIPIIVIAICLNVVSFINYKNYGIYTYDELRNSSFKDAYIKILQIKDDEKKDNVAIPKSTLYKLAELSKTLNFSKKNIDARYVLLSDKKDGEITNGNIAWYLRKWIYQKNNFKDGAEANKFFEYLSNEIEELFEEGKLEKEFAIPSVFINTPTINEIKNLIPNLFECIIYTTTYQNVKTFSVEELEKNYKYNEKNNAYDVTYMDYHNAENLIENNILEIEIIRNIYKYFTIVFSIVALIIYIKNIRKKDKINLILHIVLLVYLIIICGVTYTHTTAFEAIRYCYLGNIYILQNIFILLNLTRVYDGLMKRIKQNLYTKKNDLMEG